MFWSLHSLHVDAHICRTALNRNTGHVPLERARLQLQMDAPRPGSRYPASGTKSGTSGSGRERGDLTRLKRTEISANLGGTHLPFLLLSELQGKARGSTHQIVETAPERSSVPCFGILEFGVVLGKMASAAKKEQKKGRVAL